MKKAKRCYELSSHLLAGELYSWADLTEYSKSPGRDVKRLLDEELLKKVGPGLYLSPKKGRFGTVPASAQQLINSFLKTDDFLLVSPNYYNGLGLGLTQLKNEVFVYNKKRHGDVKLSNRTYHFKVKVKGYPKELTNEYLLVDLVNNLDEVGESPSLLLKNVADSVQANEFNNTQLFILAKQYGHVYTKKFFSVLDHANSFAI
jgi:hypothetical protein